MGECSGHLFNQRLTTPQIHEFKDDFFAVLEKVQATKHLIDDEVDVR
jgi:hypothetical protein